MSAILRAIVVLATASVISFPNQAPNVQSQGGRRRAAAPPAVASPIPAQHFVASDVEYYLTDDGIAYIRPGLKITVNSVTIPADRRAVVDLNFTDNMNQPLDRLGQTTPGAISASMILAYWDPAVRHYTAYTTRTVTTPADSPHPGVTVAQAGTDSSTEWTDLGSGHYTYRLKTALPADFDPTKTHTLGIYATRNLTDIIGKNYYANVEYDFRPDGEAVTATWAKINDATSCNNCHDPLSAHGGSRRDVKLCVLCHQPQTIDPDTGNTVDMKVMIHKIHGADTLSTPYVIIGHNQEAVDFSEVTFPQDIRNCDNCHEGTDPAKKPAQSDVYYTQPSRAACGSCHDSINWVTGDGHEAGPQTDDATCASCHIPDSGAEFDASIKGAHTIPTKSLQMAGIKAEIISVTNTAPGEHPTVTYRLTNRAGEPVDGTTLNTFAPMFAGPTTSYKYTFREAKGGSNPTAPVFDAATGLTSYTFNAAMPADATGTWAFTGDFYKTYTLHRAGDGPDIPDVRDSAVNPLMYVAVTGELHARRTVVTMKQCNACHDNLALHGGQRMLIEECVMCHNPVASDVSQRPADQGDPESISFQRMIHRIHTGDELTQPFTIFGYHGSVNDFTEVTFPGDRRNCAKCHTGDSQQLPPSEGDAVITLRDWFSPQGPGTAACLGCHDSRDAAAHAFLNTTTFRGEPAEACATCHGDGADWSVDRVHAR